MTDKTREELAVDKALEFKKLAGRALKLLHRLEWVGSGPDGAECHFCHSSAHRRPNHRMDCPLFELMTEMELAEIVPLDA